MEHIEIKQRVFGWRLVGASITPFLVESAYLFFTRWPSYRFTIFSDYAALTIAVLAGAAFVAILPIRPIQRILSLLVYIPVLATMLFFYGFWFIALVFNEGL